VLRSIPTAAFKFLEIECIEKILENIMTLVELISNKYDLIVSFNFSTTIILNLKVILTNSSHEVLYKKCN
jgi:hypothetical protein